MFAAMIRGLTGFVNDVSKVKEEREEYFHTQASQIDDELGKEIMDRYYSAYNITAEDLSKEFNIPAAVILQYMQEYSARNQNR